MHTVIHLVFALLLLMAAGVVSGKWFAFEKSKSFSFNRQMFSNKYFWLGVGAGLVFIYSDYLFAHFNSLPL